MEISYLIYHKFSNKVVCSTCKDIGAYPQKECPYKQQFIGIKKCHIVVTVIQVAYGTQLFDKFKPDIIAMDDCFDFINPQPWLKDLNYQLMNLVHLAKLKDLENDLNKAENPIEALSKKQNFDDIIIALHKAYNKDMKVLAKQVRKKNKSRYNINLLLNPEEIKKYVQMARHYGYRNRFATPAFFYIFNYMTAQKLEGKDVKFTLIEAEQPYDLLKVMKERYFKETGVTINYVDDLSFKPRFVDQNSIVFRLGRKDAWYPKQTVKLEATQKYIKKNLDFMFHYYFGTSTEVEHAVIFQKPEKELVKKVGLAKAKKIKAMRFIPEEYKNVSVETYGNLKGKNTLKNCDVLSNIGTYVIDKTEMIQMVSDWFCCDPNFLVKVKENGKMVTVIQTVEDDSHGSYYHYRCRLAEILRKRKEEYEMYQAIHRVRPLLSTKLIFAYSYVPVKKLEKDGIEVKRLLSFKKIEKHTWLEDYVRVHGGKVIRVDAEKAMAERFNINASWAYREVLKIVKKSQKIAIIDFYWLMFLNKNQQKPC